MAERVPAPTGSRRSCCVDAVGYQSGHVDRSIGTIIRRRLTLQRPEDAAMLHRIVVADWGACRRSTGKYGNAVRTHSSPRRVLARSRLVPVDVGAVPVVEVAEDAQTRARRQHSKVVEHPFPVRVVVKQSEKERLVPDDRATVADRELMRVGPDRIYSEFLCPLLGACIVFRRLVQFQSLVAIVYP